MIVILCRKCQIFLNFNGMHYNNITKYHVLLLWVYLVTPVQPAKNGITPGRPRAELWRIRKGLADVIPKAPCIVLQNAADMQSPFGKRNENASIFSFLS